MTAPTVLSFFDAATKSYSHVVADEQAGVCAIIDSVLDFDIKSGRTSAGGADELIAAVKRKGWRAEWVLETHAHADHLTAAPYLKAQLGGKLAIGANIPTVQETFRQIYNLGADFSPDGRQFDQLFADEEEFKIGGLTARVMATPGHTPACVTYVVDDAAFIGDTMFAPDYGTARCDFPGGDARALYRSIQRILGLPPETRLYQCHDYPPDGREPRPCEAVAEQRAKNVHLAGKTEDAFVAMREARDKTLDMPALLLPAVQVNIRAGAMPPPELNGISYLKIPVNRF
ncbi:MAG TPA: MBL fold metallo-hydrolase [Dongiaceae bacterium]|jgi:glyoxylase-like metal-dependent hydrolase (beta-lactamase superfamily II)|nr:MBL fold metallo-hydrolase [Dongiaceae bacterium]